MQARRLELVRRRPKLRDLSAEEQFTRLYADSTVSVAALLEKFGLSKTMLYAHAKRLGLSPVRDGNWKPEELALLRELFADVPEFLLGFFDGDGSLYRNANVSYSSWRWSLVGTLGFLVEAKRQIERLLEIHVYGPSPRITKNNFPIFGLSVNRQSHLMQLDALLNRSGLGMPCKHLPPGPGKT